MVVGTSLLFASDANSFNVVFVACLLAGSLQEARGLNPSKSLGGGGDYCALNPDAHVWDGGLRVIKEWNHRNSTIAAEEAEAQRRLQEVSLDHAICMHVPHSCLSPVLYPKCTPYLGSRVAPARP